MKKEIFTCDVCGVERKEANHWFMATSVPGSLSIGQWNSNASLDCVKHICGQVCAHKLLDEFLSK